MSFRLPLTAMSLSISIGLLEILQVCREEIEYEVNVVSFSFDL